MNKKGISAVVATILIVLLAVAAVVIVWAVLKGFLERTAGGISANCLEVDMSVDSCIKDADNVTVKATLNSGNVSKVRIIFYKASGDTLTTVDKSDVPVELGTKTWYVTGVTITDVASVNIAGVIKTEAGEDKVCQPTGQKVNC